MVKKRGIYVVSTLLLVAVVIGLIYWVNSKDVAYGIEVEKDHFEQITVNDEFISSKFQYEETTIPSSFKKVAENEQLELYLEEETIAIAVKQKSNGYVWYSYDLQENVGEKEDSQEIKNYIQSGISLITYDKFTPNRKTALDNNVEKSYEILENGFKSTIDFTTLKIKFDLFVTVQGGDLLVHVPRESIDEYNPNLWKAGNNDISLSEMIVYPFFGSVREKEDGYIVVPDGSGAIIRLDEKPKYKGAYSAPVFGKDTGYENIGKLSEKKLSVKQLEKVSLPVYGVVHEVDKTGVLVIAESGDSYATYNYESKDSTTPFYQSYFSYNYRTTYAQFQSRVNEEQHVLGFQKDPNSFDLVQRYVFVDDSQANYVGIAKKYRQFLEKKDGLSKSVSTSFEKIPMKIDFITNEMRLGTLGLETIPTTTYKQSEEITKDLIDKGMDNLSITYKSYLDKYNSYRFDVLGKLGGKRDFQSAIEFFKENKISFQYYLDYAQSYYEKTKFTASKMNRQDFSVYNTSKNLLNFMNNPKYYQSFAENDLKQFNKYDIQSVALDGMGGNIFTHYDKGKIGSSTEGLEYSKQLLTYLQENNVQTSVYAPDAYLYKYIDKYYDAPIYSSELMVTDSTIPFVSLVLSGYKEMYSPYLNFSSNDRDEALKLIEFGIYPSYVLTGESTYYLKETASSNIYVSQMEHIGERMNESYDLINKALKETIGSEMINHMIIDKGIVKATYSNSVEIIINYNTIDYQLDGVEIKAKGFVIL
ncbi:MULTISPECIES: DUF5696 domain-containing protein [Niallia]|uniref:Uncharacterized protein n=1 Tax=Niallia alba TaxID=2729105 RepID=A0A7Y0PNG6_9BACI|nr:MULTISPECIES: DUF5696 domain-containing protein [Niallia]EOR22744.1 hypothetical protein A499_16326 [Niallia nealsonii AAU1]NMO79082.1 hypothetical protein [Niallia alba]UTI42408.1 DUF5696 domain-containing protein [Niallia sp. RD1]